GYGDATELAPQLRRPIAAAKVSGDRLLVANQRSGTVSIVDLSARTVAAEATVGSELSDLIALVDGNHFLASDQKRHELVLLGLNEGKPNVIRREPTVRYPARMVTSQDGRRVYVAGLWSHSLQAFELRIDSDPTISASRIITLP